MIGETVEELTPIIGTRPACRALGASPATIYRRRRPPEPRPPRPRPTPARALSEPEREAVLEVLHSRAVRRHLAGGGVRDAAGRGHLPVLDADDVPAAGRPARRCAGAARPAHPPCLRQARAAGRAAERAVELGHHQAQGPGEVDVRSTCT